MSNYTRNCCNPYYLFSLTDDILEKLLDGLDSGNEAHNLAAWYEPLVHLTKPRAEAPALRHGEESAAS